MYLGSELKSFWGSRAWAPSALVLLTTFMLLSSFCVLPVASIFDQGGGGDFNTSDLSTLWREAFSYSKEVMEETSVWGITTLLSPSAQYLKIYNIWYDSVKRQGLQVLLVHAARSGELSVGEPAADIVVQHTIPAYGLVSRETLLNIALTKLPNSCDKIIWIDCNVIMSNKAWVSQTSSALDSHAVVQPFSFFSLLPPGVTALDDEAALYLSIDHMNPAGVFHSAGVGLSAFGRTTGVLNDHRYLGHPGGAWAAKRQIVEYFKFFEGFVLGGGDLAMVAAFCGVSPSSLPLLGEHGQSLLAQWKRLVAWSNRVYRAVHCDIGIIAGIAGNLWREVVDTRVGERYDPLVRLHKWWRHQGGRAVTQPIWMLDPSSIIVYDVAKSRLPSTYTEVPNLEAFWRPESNNFPWIQLMWSEYQTQFVAHQPHLSTLLGPFTPRSKVFQTKRVDRTLAPGAQPELCGITSFFNLLRYPNKIVHFRRFRAMSRRQGLFLVTAELVFDQEPFEVMPNDTDVLISLRISSENAMFHKEHLLNVALEKLPSHCIYVAWVDGDVMFSNDNWIAETIVALQTYSVVQPFAFCFRLLCGQEWVDPNTALLWGTVLDSPIFMHHSVGYGMTMRTTLHGRLDHSFCSNYFVRGHPGFAFASHTHLIRKAGGFFDFIVGAGGDTMMALGLLSLYCQQSAFASILNALPESVINTWIERLPKWTGALRGAIGYTRGFIYHMWHGSLEKRQNLGQRSKADIYSALREKGFNPMEHLVLNKSTGLAVLGHRDLANAVRQYFVARDENPSRCPRWKAPRCLLHCGYRKWLWDEYRISQMAEMGSVRLDAAIVGDLNIVLIQQVVGSVTTCLTFVPPSGSFNYQSTPSLFTKRCSEQHFSDDMMWALHNGQLISLFWIHTSILLQRCVTISTATLQPILVPCVAHQATQNLKWEYDDGQILLSTAKGPRRCLDVINGEVQLFPRCYERWVMRPAFEKW